MGGYRVCFGGGGVKACLVVEFGWVRMGLRIGLGGWGFRVGLG